MVFNKKLIVIASGVVVGLLAIFLMILEWNKSSTEQPITQTSLPTITPYQNSNPGADHLPVVIKPTDFQRFQDKMTNKLPLSDTDTQVKNILTAQADTDTGLIYQASNFNVFYYDSVDEFDVQILSPDITQTKKDAVAWFLGQGLSQQGVCALPVTFSLSAQVIQSNQGKTYSFSKLPDGC